MTSEAQFRRVQQEGKRVRTPFLTVRAAASPLAQMRIGIIVPLHGHTAVARNLLKRRLREIARLELLPQHLPLDIVIRTAEPAYGLPYPRLREQVTALVRRVAGA